MFSEIRNYLQERGRAPLTDLAHRFDMDEDALRGMLDLWVKKGKVTIHNPDGACGGCTACDLGSQEICEWTGG